jgi:DNA (cytosine-5)-methyltransferase 1
MSLYTGGNSKLQAKLDKYFAANNLEDIRKKPADLSKYMRVNYEDEALRQEADASQPNDTPSRRDIFVKSVKLFDGSKYSDYVPTITTKQDRRPNAGVVVYDSHRVGKSTFRYLTARECLLLMGFDDSDYEALVQGNFKKDITKDFFTTTKIVKIAGNSIVVPVLEEVFKQMIYVDEYFLSKVAVEEPNEAKVPVGELGFAT